MLGARPAKLTQLRCRCTGPPIIAHQVHQCLYRCLDPGVLTQAEFHQGIQHDRGIAEHPEPLVFACAAKVSRDVHQHLKGAILRLVAENPIDDLRNTEVIGPEPKISNKGQFVQQVAGIIMTFQRGTRPLRQFGQQRLNKRMRDHSPTGCTHLWVILGLIQQVHAGSILYPRRTLQQPINRRVRVLFHMSILSEVPGRAKLCRSRRYTASIYANSFGLRSLCLAVRYVSHS